MSPYCFGTWHLLLRDGVGSTRPHGSCGSGSARTSAAAGQNSVVSPRATAKLKPGTRARGVQVSSTPSSGARRRSAGCGHGRRLPDWGAAVRAPRSGCSGGGLPWWVSGSTRGPIYIYIYNILYVIYIYIYLFTYIYIYIYISIYIYIYIYIYVCGVPRASPAVHLGGQRRYPALVSMHCFRPERQNTTTFGTWSCLASSADDFDLSLTFAFDCLSKNKQRCGGLSLTSLSAGIRPPRVPGSLSCL